MPHPEMETSPACLMPEEKLAYAVLSRAVEDIEQYHEIAIGKKILKRPENKRYRRYLACDGIAFFFMKRNTMRDWWLQVSGLRIEAVRENLLKQYPWITTL